MQLAKRLLHDAVLQRMEGDHQQPPAGGQQVHKVAERLPERVQLVVQRDAHGLERAAGRMPVVLAAHGFGDGRIHHGHQVARGQDRRFRPPFHKDLRNARGPFFLAILGEDAAKLLL